jgi:hypothetical protein
MAWPQRSHRQRAMLELSFRANVWDAHIHTRKQPKQ